MRVMKYRRGQIWWFENTYSFDGSVQGGKRPAIIVSNNKANSFSKNLIVVPCTSQVKRLDMKTHVKFSIDETENIALCENLMSANIQKLTEYIGSCDDELLSKIEKGVQVAIGLCETSTEQQTTTDVDEHISTLTDEEEIKPRLGRRPKYSHEDMQRFINDYENHDIQYMMNKYKEVSEGAVANKIYRFRKILNSGG